MGQAENNSRGIVYFSVSSVVLRVCSRTAIAQCILNLLNKECVRTCNRVQVHWLVQSQVKQVVKHPALLHAPSTWRRQCLASTPMSTRSDECVPYESSLLGGCRVYDVLGSCQLTPARSDLLLSHWSEKGQKKQRQIPLVLKGCLESLIAEEAVGCSSTFWQSLHPNYESQSWQKGRYTGSEWAQYKFSRSWKTVHKRQHPQEQARGPFGVGWYLHCQQAANTCLSPSQKWHCGLVISKHWQPANLLDWNLVWLDQSEKKLRGMLGIWTLPCNIIVLDTPSTRNSDFRVCCWMVM